MLLKQYEAKAPQHQFKGKIYLLDATTIKLYLFFYGQPSAKYRRQ